MPEQTTPAEPIVAFPGPPKCPCGQNHHVMSTWVHSHDLQHRGSVYPVMSKVVGGVQLMFQADGSIHWIRHPVAGWAHRGSWKHGVTLRSVLYPKEHNPELALPVVPELPAAEVVP